jgi:asparagine synthase (glutamine-hydrolysing)
MCDFVYFSTCFYTAGSGFVKYFRPEYEDYLNANQELDLAAINATLTNKRLRIVWACSLGLDSSLLASLPQDF